MKRIIACIAALALIGTGLCSCSESTEQAEVTETSADDTRQQIVDTAVPDSMFEDDDHYRETAGAVNITLADGQTKADGGGVSVEGDVVTVTAPGTYRLSGVLTDGQLAVDVKNKGKVQLVFDGAEITSKGSAAVYVADAGKVTAVLAEGSHNRFASVEEFAQNDIGIDAAVFSKSDITFTGNGSLEINSEKGHGAVSKDDLKFTGGSYNIVSANKALSANDSLCFNGGSYVIESGADGIQCENTENTELGYIYAANCDFDINSGRDCVDGSGSVTIESGSFKLTSGGGSVNAPEKAENPMGRFGRELQQTSETENTGSYKALKSGGALVISDGEFIIDSADDALHSNSTLSVNGGSFDIKAGDDAVHADDVLEISGGVIKADCYEGIEADVVNILGGDIDIIASDDGMNAAGGNDEENYDKFRGDANAGISISGGTLKIRSDGDGIDSNGYLRVSGGSVYISGPFGTGNGAVDYQTEGVISGGTFIAAGSSEMSMNFGKDSTQCSVMHTFSQTHNEGEEISFTGGDLNISFAPGNKYQSIVISAPDIKQGESYTLSAGDEKADITVTDIITGGSGMGFGGFGGGGRFKDKDRSDGNMPQMPDGTLPNGEFPRKPDRVMPDGMPQGEPPQMPPEGMNGGEPPQMPFGETPSETQAQ